MEKFISYVGDLMSEIFQAVIASVIHNWWILALATVIAVIIKTYVNSAKLNKILLKRRKVSIIASVLFGAFTPFCACGTSAVVLGMLTTTLPWGPIMAFLTSSPLMSPDGFVFISGIINVDFAVALTIASLVIGLLSGFLTNLIEKKTKFLNNQSRYLETSNTGGCSCADPRPVKISRSRILANRGACSCGSQETSVPIPDNAVIQQEAYSFAAVLQPGGDCCSGNVSDNSSFQLDNVRISGQGEACCIMEQGKKHFTLKEISRKLKLKELLVGIYELGIKRMLLLFSFFIAVGYLINHFIPTSIISALFGANSFYAVPLASLIGLPLYITTESGMPIIQSMIASGASEGAMLAFIITGSATSAWVIAGLSTFMKKRALLLYVGFILVGGMISGYLYDLFNLLF